MRAEIAATAIELFLEQGFEQTTIDQLVAAAGISRRSFFRYFPAKEDVVLGFMADIGDSIVAALAARPLDEPLWESLRRACDPGMAQYAIDAERALALIQLCDRTPSLRARQVEKHLHWQQGLTGVLAQRLGVDPADDLRPAVFAGAAMAAFQAAVDAWSAHPSRTLDTALDAAFAALSTY